jgi:hypothetical protein
MLWAIDQLMDINKLPKLWKKISSNALLCAQLVEFMKVRVGFGSNYGICGR